MPIKINFIDYGLGVEFVSSGKVNGKQIIEANNKIYNSEILPKLKYKIVDRTACTEYNVTTEEIKIIAEQDEMALKINPDILIVLISKTLYQYGMTRMWEAYIDEPEFQSKIFEDRASADNWIKTKFSINSAAV